mmetsp:Transcript_11933/g.41250  ORF Transcript_11933/g.41250 Transcript_11933/m.41250 type:complete len:299 (-) Transcript_11933:456-1352(-)
MALRFWSISSPTGELLVGPLRVAVAEERALGKVPEAEVLVPAGIEVEPHRVSRTKRRLEQVHAVAAREDVPGPAERRQVVGADVRRREQPASAGRRHVRQRERRVGRGEVEEQVPAVDQRARAKGRELGAEHGRRAFVDDVELEEARLRPRFPVRLDDVGNDVGADVGRARRQVHVAHPVHVAAGHVDDDFEFELARQHLERRARVRRRVDRRAGPGARRIPHRASRGPILSLIHGSKVGGARHRRAVGTLPGPCAVPARDCRGDVDRPLAADDEGRPALRDDGAVHFELEEQSSRTR